MDWSPNAAAVGAILGWLAGWWVPALIRLVPEPESAMAGEGEQLKELYVDIAADRGLAWQTAIAGGFATGLIGGSVGWGLLLVLVPLVPVGVALAVIDWRTRLLPRVIVLPATGYAVMACSLLSLLDGETNNLSRGIFGLLLARGTFWLMWRVHAAGMGFGDVRLAGLVGFVLGYLGWGPFLLGIYSSFLLLGVPGLSYAVIRRDRGFLRVAVPFGPFMLIGAVLGLVFGQTLTRLLGN